MNNTIESEENAVTADVSQPKAKHAATKKSKPVKKAVRAKKPATSRPTPDRANKKTEVIALMKRAQGVTLAEIMKARVGSHTVRGFVRIFRQQRWGEG